MAAFEELQSLWQSQDGRAAPRFDAAAAASAFRRYGRRQDIINTVKAVLLSAAMVQVVLVGRHRPLFLFAFSMIVFSGVLALITEWRNQRAIAAFDFSAPSVAFVRGTIARLRQQRNPFHTREFAILFGAIFVGYNLMVLNAYDKWPLSQRIAGHLMGTLFPIVIYGAGRMFRARRWEAECRPLVDRLTLLLATLEERGQ